MGSSNINTVYARKEKQVQRRVIKFNTYTVMKNVNLPQRIDRQQPRKKKDLDKCAKALKSSDREMFQVLPVHATSLMCRRFALIRWIYEVM